MQIPLDIIDCLQIIVGHASLGLHQLDASPAVLRAHLVAIEAAGWRLHRMLLELPPAVLPREEVP